MTRYRVPDYWRTDKARMGLWDGYKHMMRRRGQVFPTGLLHRIVKRWNERGVKYTIVDVRDKPKFKFRNWDLLPDEDGNPWEVRPYQDDAVALGIHYGRGLFHIATGGGKTGVAAMLWKGLGCPRGAIFVHTKVLLNQHKKFLEKRLGVPVGQIGEGVWDPKQLTIVLINSAYPPGRKKPDATKKEKDLYKKRVERWGRVREWLHELEFFFSDECHLVGDNLWHKVLMECVNAYYRFAGSGTPFSRSPVERHLLVAATGQRLIHIPYRKLLKWGYVCPTILYAVPLDEEFRPKNNYDYPSAYREIIVEDTDRHNLIKGILKKFGDGRTSLVLVTIIDHGRHLEAILRDAGFKVKFIYGGSKKADRVSALEELADGRLDVLVASGILDQGLDLPDLSLIVNAGGGKAETRALQKVGRGVRNAPDKDALIYVDVFDYGNKYLRGHSIDRLKIYHDEGGYSIRVLERDDIDG
jgi:superfamily II DNA or RNA helicase